jgi:[CysO sulfur-carrier protein]-S-L-cysteine hydrolase
MDSITPDLIILGNHWEQMRADVIQRTPEEACGLVAGTDNRSRKVFEVKNTLQSPTRFRMDPQQQLEALLRIEENKWDLLAIYHSHPAGPAYPSPTDLSDAAYPEAANLIWYPQEGDWSCRGFMIYGGTFKEITIGITNW